MQGIFSDPIVNFRNIADNLREGLIITDIYGLKIIYVNKTFEKMTGYKFEEIIGNTPRMFYGKNTQKSELTKIKTALEKYEPISAELINYNKNGDEYWISFNAVTLFDENKNPKYFLALESDITERKKMEMENQYITKRLSATLNTVIDGIITINQRGVIEAFNQSAEKIFGYNSAEVVGKNVKILMPSEHAKVHDNYLKNYLSSGEAKIIGIGRELVAQKKDGNLFPIELGISEVKLENENFFVGIVRDISERKQQEESLRIAKEEAEKANISKSEFLANMSHEFRTPLHAMIGFSEIMLEKGDNLSTEKRISYLKMMLKSGDRLLALINGLLDLAKLESGMMQFCFQQDDLHQLAESAIMEVQELSLKKNITISLEFKIGRKSFIFDYARITQVMINLLSNAIKFTPEGKNINIIIEEVEDKLLVIQVKDQGVGIPELEIEKIFEKFIQSSKTATGAGGTGLGLSICSSIIEAHKGKIWAENNKDEGASFYFSLPNNLNEEMVEM